MSEITIERINAFVSAQQPVLWESATKGLLLLAGVWLLTLAMRRRSAAMLHVLWTAALVAMFALPLLSVSLPEWEALPAEVEILFPEAPVAEIVAPPPVAPDFPTATIAPELLPIETPAADPALAAASPLPENLSIPAIIACVWLVGTFVLLAKIGISQLWLWVLARRCEQVDDATVERLREGLGIARSVVVLRGGKGAMPMTWGMLHPKLLLPADAENWGAEKLESVVLHELGHVKRWDALTNLLAKFACAVYWPNPFVWLAAWRMHIERERACDDLVLASGVTPSTYADCLLQIAAGSTGRSPDVAIAMAKQARIERRLIDILSESRRRRAVTWGVLAVILLALGIVVPPLAMLKAQEKKEVGKDDFIDLNLDPESVEFEGFKNYGRPIQKDPAPERLTSTGRIEFNEEEGLAEVTMGYDEFIEKKPREWQEITVRLRADDYYNFGFDEENWRSLRLFGPKDDSKPLYGYFPKDWADGEASPLAIGETTRRATVVVRFSDTRGRDNQVEVKRFVPDLNFRAEEEFRGYVSISNSPNSVVVARWFAEKLEKIMIPKFVVEDATVEEALTFLRVKARELDSGEELETKGVGFILRIKQETPKISVTLSNVTLGAAFREVVKQASLGFWIKDSKLVVADFDRIEELESLLKRGVRSYDIGKFAQARADFEEALILDPGNKGARRLLDRTMRKLDPEWKPIPGDGAAKENANKFSFQLRRADAGEVATAISEALDALPDRSEKRIVTADVRTNRILYVGDDAYFPFVKKLAAQFDKPAEPRVSDRDAALRMLMERLAEGREEAQKLETSGLGEKHPSRIRAQRAIRFLEEQIFKEGRAPAEGSTDLKMMELELELEKLKASGLGSKHPKIWSIEAEIEARKSKREF